MFFERLSSSFMYSSNRVYLILPRKAEPCPRPFYAGCLYHIRNGHFLALVALHLLINRLHKFLFRPDLSDKGRLRLRCHPHKFPVKTLCPVLCLTHLCFSCRRVSCSYSIYIHFLNLLHYFCQPLCRSEPHLLPRNKSEQFIVSMQIYLLTSPPKFHTGLHLLSLICRGMPALSGATLATSLLRRARNLFPI